MRPLVLVALGLVLVALDLRIGGLDLLPDPLGWVVAAVGAGLLRDRHVGFLVAAVACAAGVLLSLPDMAVEGAGRAGRTGAPSAGAEDAVVVLLQTVVLFSTCTAISRILPDTGVGRVAGVLRWVDLALTAAVQVLVVLLVSGTGARVLRAPSGGPDPVTALVVLLGAGVLVGALVHLAVLVVASRQPVPEG